MINYSDDLQGRYQQMEHEVIALRREVARLGVFEERYLAMCRENRATCMMHLGMLAAEGDPDLATALPVVSVVAAS